MWKIAIALMLLATSAFGAIQLQVPLQGGNNAAGSTFSVPVMLVNSGITNPEALAGGATGVTGLSFWLQTNAEGVGKIQLTGRTVNAATNLVDFTTSDAQVPLPLNLSAARSAKDLGSTTSTQNLPQSPTGVLYMTLTFAVTGDVPLNTPITIVDASYGDDMFSNWAFDAGSNATFQITPEPASMLLLAAGAAFFARRRRA